MKKQLLKSALMAVVGAGLLAGGAMADPFNLNRPYDPIDNSVHKLTYTGGVYTPGGNEVSLQTIFNDKITGGSIDAITGQSSAALWSQAEGSADAYLVSLLTAGSDDLFIYSASTAAAYLLTPAGNTSASFTVNGSKLFFGQTLIDATFGSTFGFCYGSSCTEDSKNSNNDIKALSYLLNTGITANTLAFGGNYQFSASGNNDWILAFEDGSDRDFQDAVFVVEDMKPVPEPATMLLFGTGIAGLAGVVRRRRAHLS